MRVVDRLRRTGIGVGPDRTIKDVAQIMEAIGVGAVVVVDEAVPIGIVTDRDLVRRALAAGLPGDARVDAIMTSDVVTIDADADVSEAHDLVRRHGVRRVVVVKEERFVGLVSLDDLLIDDAAYLHQLARAVAGEVHHPDRESPMPVVPA